MIVDSNKQTNKIAQFDPASRKKTRRRTKHEVDPLQSCDHLKFCNVWGRSPVVGRRLLVNIHIS